MQQFTVVIYSLNSAKKINEISIKAKNKVDAYKFARELLYSDDGKSIPSVFLLEVNNKMVQPSLL